MPLLTKHINQKHRNQNQPDKAQICWVVVGRVKCRCCQQGIRRSWNGWCLAVAYGHQTKGFEPSTVRTIAGRSRSGSWQHDPETKTTIQNCVNGRMTHNRWWVKTSWFHGKDHHWTGEPLQYQPTGRSGDDRWFWACSYWKWHQNVLARYCKWFQGFFI